MNNPFANKKFRLPFYKNTITVILTPGKMLLLGIIALCAIIWFFFLGLLLGRGEYPERAIPEISNLMPQSNGTDAPLTILTVEPSSDVEQRTVEKKVEIKGTSDTVEQVTDAKKTTVKQVAEIKKIVAKQPVKKQESQKNNKNVAQETTKKIKQSTPQKTVAKVPPSSDEVFDYVYQIASFKEEKSANLFADKVKKAGLKTRVTSSKSGSTIWSRVVVDFRGTPNDTARLRERLKPFNVDKMVMLKKKAIKNK